MGMLQTTEIDMTDTVSENDIADFLTNAAWAIRSTYHIERKASPGAAIFRRGMFFDMPFIADWNQIGNYRQCQTDRNTRHENKTRIDWDYKVGKKVLVRKDGNLDKTESRHDGDPWTIMSVHTNGRIRVQRETKSEHLNI